jgi:hypothetical protein
MCFVLYVGTVRPIPRREWRKDAPDISVRDLSSRELALKAKFESPEVQYVGSTSHCGCDFPHTILQNGNLPPLEGAKDADQVIVERQNRDALVKLLREVQEPTVQVYGTWDGSEDDLSKAPLSREMIAVERILDPTFYFKEQGFYCVEIRLSKPAG